MTEREKMAASMLYDPFTEGMPIGEGSVIGAGSVITRDIPATALQPEIPAALSARLPKKTVYTSKKACAYLSFV